MAMKQLSARAAAAPEAAKDVSWSHLTNDSKDRLLMVGPGGKPVETDWSLGDLVNEFAAVWDDVEKVEAAIEALKAAPKAEP